MLFDKKIILLDYEITSRENALSALSDSLYAADQVTSEFKNSILSRESNFPTGLQTKTIGVAIPHTNADKVISEQMGFLRLKDPVIFNQMGDNKKINVKLIFMLALKNPDKQLHMLQTLMQLFQNKDSIDQILKVDTTDEFVRVMNNFGIN